MIVYARVPVAVLARLAEAGVRHHVVRRGAKNAVVAVPGRIARRLADAVPEARLLGTWDEMRSLATRTEKRALRRVRIRRVVDGRVIYGRVPLKDVQPGDKVLGPVKAPPVREYDAR